MPVYKPQTFVQIFLMVEWKHAETTKTVCREKTRDGGKESDHKGRERVNNDNQRQRLGQMPSPLPV